MGWTVRRGKVSHHLLQPRCYYGHRHLPFQECRLGGNQDGSGQFRLSLREWHPVQRHDFKSLSIQLQVYFDRESRSRRKSGSSGAS